MRQYGVTEEQIQGLLGTQKEDDAAAAAAAKPSILQPYYSAPSKANINLNNYSYVLLILTFWTN